MTLIETLFFTKLVIFKPSWVKLWHDKYYFKPYLVQTEICKTNRVEPFGLGLD